MTQLWAMPRRHDFQLAVGRSIKWDRPVNREAIMAFTGGNVAGQRN